MSATLFRHINQYVTLSKDEFVRVLRYFRLKSYKKKEYISSIHGKCIYNHFVVEGCLHMCFTDDKGTQRTVQFAIENWWLTDNLAFLRNQKTDFNIQAVEPSNILSISFEEQEAMLKEFPKLERYFRNIYQVAYGASMLRLKYIFAFSKEERYFHFTEKHPQFAQRVPQYLIASFLGLTPEYVSEIRAKRFS